MVAKRIHGVRVECVQGDIANQDDVEAVVNAANAQLRMGGGVAGAIHRGAGPKLAEATRKYAPIEPGEAVITDAFELPNDFVIHCLGPVHGRDKPDDELLASCYRESLVLAEQNDVSSVGFPAISTGAFGYPMKGAAEVGLGTVHEELENVQGIELVRFVLFGDDGLRIHEETLEELVG